MRKYIENILYGNITSITDIPILIILHIFEALYAFASGFRNFLYNKGLLKVNSVPCRVISVGNLTVGGTGKTPVVIMTARMLQNAGHSVVVVSGGYGGSAKKPLIVSDGAFVSVSAEVAGDEPVIIARALQGIPVVVGKDRFGAAQLAYDHFHPKVIVLDDAFQHRRLYRTIDVVTIDAVNPIGNEHMLPRGMLRESPHALKRAHAVIVTRFDDRINRGALERTVKYYNRKVPIYLSAHTPVGLRLYWKRESVSLDLLKRKKIGALCNIAQPESFYRLLSEYGADIVFKRPMPDHHRYSTLELKQIEADAIKAGAELLVMTEKDEMNLPAGYDVKVIEKAILEIRADLLEDNDKYIELICPKK